MLVAPKKAAYSLPMPLDNQNPKATDSQAPRWAYSACPHDCPSTCALEVEVLSPQRIGKVRGHRDHPYTDGVICAKVARYAERIHHPERLLYPMKRTAPKGCGIEGFERISWEAALEEVAQRFLEIEKTHGAEAIWPYFYAGTMGHVQRDGINRLRNSKGYSRFHDTICTALADAGWRAGVGGKAGVDSREMVESDLIVVWGGNPVNTQVNVMHWIAKARKGKGAKLVVVDPYRTGTAQQADLHLCLKPGTDGALAAAVMHVILREGLEDRAFLLAMSDFDAEVEAHLSQTTPAWAAKITGLSEAEIEAFALLYGRTKKSFIRVGYGFARSRNGATSVHAVSCLPTLTGAWKHRGGGALWGNGDIYALDKSLIEGTDREDRSVRKLDQSRFGPILTGDKKDLGEGPPVMALLIQNTNPAVVCPESRKCIEGLLRPDLFTVVHEQFLTDTARYADILLPATAFLEHDDYYTASGHTFLQVTEKIIEAPGECRSNHEVICELGRRLGADHPGFDLSARDLIDQTLQSSGYGTLDAIKERGWVDRAQSWEEMHFLTGFAHPDRKFHFKPEWEAIGKDVAGMPGLPGFWPSIDQSDEKHPFRLVAAPARTYLNTSFTETPGSQKREGRPTLLIHPETAAQAGLEDGGRVRVGNSRDSIVVHAKYFEGLQREVLVIESIWPNSAFEEGIGVNALISAEAGKPRGGAVFHDTAVWIEVLQ